MGDPLPELHAKELAFYALVSEFYNDYPKITENYISNFIFAVGEYSKQLNSSLKTYSEIDYFKNTGDKIKMKAVIKFAYDLLSMLTSIIKNFKADPPKFDEVEYQIRIINELIYNKQSLVSTTYHEAANQELKAFYDKSFRSNLESQINKHLEDKQSKE